MSSNSPIRFSIQHMHPTGCIDFLEIEPSGLIRIIGWRKYPEDELKNFPSCFFSNKEIPLSQHYSTYRADVSTNLQAPTKFFGVVFEFFYSKNFSGVIPLEIFYKNQSIFKQNIPVNFVVPAYSALLTTAEVKKRDDVYLEGPPVTEVAKEVYALVDNLEGKVLDFGSGIGNLVYYLRQKNVEAFGIELDRPAIAKQVIPAVKDFITLYDGSEKLPFLDNQFEHTISIEVLEHIPKLEEMLDEIARVTSKQFILTVPDASAIPLLHHTFTVPWHLLESTHLNFFNHHSLYTTLKKRFSSVRMGKICPVETNQTSWNVSLFAVCQK